MCVVTMLTMLTIGNRAEIVPNKYIVIIVLMNSNDLTS